MTSVSLFSSFQINPCGPFLAASDNFSFPVGCFFFIYIDCTLETTALLSVLCSFLVLQVLLMAYPLFYTNILYKTPLNTVLLLFFNLDYIFIKIRFFNAINSDYGSLLTSPSFWQLPTHLNLYPFFLSLKTNRHLK